METDRTLFSENLVKISANTNTTHWIRVLIRLQIRLSRLDYDGSDWITMVWISLQWFIRITTVWNGLKQFRSDYGGLGGIMRVQIRLWWSRSNYDV